MRKLPKINVEELRKAQEENFEERLKFVKTYAEWMKRTPNRIWSKQHKELID